MTDPKLAQADKKRIDKLKHVIISMLPLFFEFLHGPERRALLFPSFFVIAFVFILLKSLPLSKFFLIDIVLFFISTI